MGMAIGKAFLVLVLLLIGEIQSRCQNGGVKILIRRKQAPFLTGYECLCPFNYYGQFCQNILDLYCRFTNQKSTKYNPQQSPIAQLEFDLQCYLLKMNPDIPSKQQTGKNNYNKLPLTAEQVQTMTQQRYTALPGPDSMIIWANDTSLFDNTGALKHKTNQTSLTDQQILSRYPVYKFEYPTQFMGVPVINQIFDYQLKAVGFVGRGFEIGKISLQFHQVKEVQGVVMKGRFNVSVQRQWEEFGVVRLELRLESMYGEQEDKMISKRVGINSAKWRIYNPNFEKGSPLSYSTYKMPPSFYIILAFTIIFLTITGARVALKSYKNYKQKKSRKLAHQDNEEDRYGE